MLMCMCMYLRLSVSVSVVHESTGVHRAQKREFCPSKLELPAVVSCLTWVLGTEFFKSS